MQGQDEKRDRERLCIARYARKSGQRGIVWTDTSSSLFASTFIPLQFSSLPAYTARSLSRLSSFFLSASFCLSSISISPFSFTSLLLSSSPSFCSCQLFPFPHSPTPFFLNFLSFRFCSLLQERRITSLYRQLHSPIVTSSHASSSVLPLFSSLCLCRSIFCSDFLVSPP